MLLDINLALKLVRVVLLLLAFSLVTEAATPTFKLPTVRFQELSSVDGAAVLLHELVTLGAVAVTDIPGFAEARHGALTSVPTACTGEAQNIMPDGKTRRWTVATSTQNSIQMALGNSKRCNTAAAPLRALIGMASNLVFQALDVASDRAAGSSKTVPTPQPLMKRVGDLPDYSTFSELLGNGTQLEHFHVYFPEDEIAASKQQEIGGTMKETIPFHTDSGILIAMTAGLGLEVTPNWTFKQGLRARDPSAPRRLNMESLETFGQLKLVLPHGTVVNAQAAPDSLIFLVGSGASWLDAVQMRPVPHALRIQPTLKPSQEPEQQVPRTIARSWHGRMFLPPWDAGMPAPFKGDDDMTTSFHAFRAAQRESIYQRGEKAVDGNTDSWLGCDLGFDQVQNKNIEEGSEEGEMDHLQVPWALRGGKGYLRSLAGTDDDCAGDTVKCWMQDMPACSLPCGMEAVCVDTVTGAVVSGDITCPDGIDACELQCQDDTSPNKTGSRGGFCTGSGLDMYMSGFTSIFQPGDVACLNILFQGWTLSNPWTFALACCGTICLAMGTEGLVNRRRKLFRETPPSRFRDIFTVLLYGVQTILGYFIMLIAMTYQVELFMCVVLGLMMGHATFNLNAPPLATTDPCCVGRDSLDSTGAIQTERYPYLLLNGLPVIILHLEGLTCQTCVNTCSAALRAVPGVIDVRISLKSGEAAVTIESSPMGPKVGALVDAVESVGFSAELTTLQPGA